MIADSESARRGHRRIGRGARHRAASRSSASGGTTDAALRRRPSVA
jgi:hypothetical protein